MICEIILNYKGETNAIIFSKSFSAGTLIALCCKNIYMHHNAFLSPVDVIHNSFFDSTQLSSIKNVLENKHADKIDDNTFILADQAIKCKIILNNIFEKICKIHNFDNETKKIIYTEIFEGEKYTHDTTFSFEYLKSIGINVKQINKQMIKIAQLNIYQNTNIY
jgi:membrane-bound ClpP family serine protease